MTTLNAYIDTDNVLSITGLKRSVADTFENAASVTVTLTDSDGVQVTGETWPLAMAYEASSNGNYRATLVDSLNVTENAFYTATITADAGAGFLRTFHATLKYIKG